MSQDNNQKIIVHVEEDLNDLIPNYLTSKQQDTMTLKNALEKNDFETIRILGHNMRGSGAGYGFRPVSEIGAVIEQSAKDKDAGEISRQIEKLTDYMERVEVVFYSP